MSFLSKLKKLVTSIPADVADTLNNRDSMTNASRPVQPSAPQPTYTPAPTSVSYNNVPVELKSFDYFTGIIERQFPGCIIEQKVPVTRYAPAAHPACVPIDFLFSKNGTPVLAIALVKKNNYRGMNVIATKNICEANGIRYIRFFLDMENEPTYVVNRIREYLV